MTPLPYRIIDAFTSSPYSGNPAAVVLFSSADDSRSADPEYMVKVSREFALSETAFLVPQTPVRESPVRTASLVPQSSADSTPNYGLRWFTPTVEFPLCGHATLASSHFLFTEQHPDATRLQFETMSGTLYASKLAGGRIELDFPADVRTADAVHATEEDKLRGRLQQVDAALAAAVVGVARGKLGWIIELSQDFALEKMEIDPSPLRDLPGYFMFTQSAKTQHAGYDIYTRVLDPVEADPEDAVTGSAHCMLAPYWLTSASSRLPNPEQSVQSKTLRAKQGGRRQGSLEAEWDVEAGRVKLRGSAVTVAEGRLLA
ncbi:hypothetical protein JCM10207_008171 [Rhodosporidiobolus poonsookiae]